MVEAEVVPAMPSESAVPAARAEEGAEAEPAAVLAVAVGAARSLAEASADAGE
jgi:hypothetical protein